MTAEQPSEHSPADLAELSKEAELSQAVASITSQLAELSAELTELSSRTALLTDRRASLRAQLRQAERTLSVHEGLRRARLAQERQRADAEARRAEKRRLSAESEAGRTAAKLAALEQARAAARAAREAERQARLQKESEDMLAAVAARRQAMLDAVPERAVARFAACRADADLTDGDGIKRYGGHPPAARNLNEVEWAILRDPQKSIHEVAQILGLFPIHVDQLRKAPPPAAKKGPGRPPELSADAVREIRRSLKTAKELAAFHGVSPGYIGQIRRGEVRMDVPL